MKKLPLISKGGLPFKNVTLNVPRLATSTYSAGLAWAMAQTSEIEWKTVPLPGLLKALYWLMWWKEPPGGVVFDVAPAPKLHELAYGWAKERQTHALEAFAKGPQHGLTYMQNLEQIRKSYLEIVRERAKAAGLINQQVDKQLTEAIQAAAVVKLVGQVTMAGLTLIAGIPVAASVAVGSSGVTLGGATLAASVVKFAFDLLITNVEGFDVAGTAEVVTATAGQEVGSGIIDKEAQKVTARMKYVEKLIQDAHDDIARLAKKLGEEVWTQLGPILQTQPKPGYTAWQVEYMKGKETEPHLLKYIASKKPVLDEYGRQIQHQTNKLEALKFSKGLLPVIFFGYDVWSALRTFAKDWQLAAQ